MPPGWCATGCLHPDGSMTCAQCSRSSVLPWVLVSGGATLLLIGLAERSRRRARVAEAAPGGWWVETVEGASLGHFADRRAAEADARGWERRLRAAGQPERILVVRG